MDFAQLRTDQHPLFILGGVNEDGVVDHSDLKLIAGIINTWPKAVLDPGGFLNLTVPCASSI